jgi:hypothetical protein
VASRSSRSVAARCLSLGVLGALGVLLAGCSATVGAEPSVASVANAQAWCESTGGWWRPTLNYCEYQDIRY